MAQFFLLGMASFGLFFPLQAACKLADLYETCHWKNNAFTGRIADEAENYCMEGNTIFPHCLFEEPINLPSMSPYFSTPENQCRNSRFLSDLSLHHLSGVHEDLIAYNLNQPQSYEIPKECFFASTALGLKLWPPETSSYYYCNSSQADQTCESMAFHHNQLLPNSCQMNHQPAGVQRELNRPPCLDDRYINLTTKAFNQVMDCFGFTSQEEKEQMFSLFLVESLFLLNKIEERPEGKTTNRCFAQIRDDFVGTLNQYIYFGDREKKGPRVSAFYEYGDIYKKAVEQCPFLKQALTPPSHTLQGKTLCRYDSKTKTCKGNPFKEAHVEHRGSIRCKTSGDPYSCLFYAIYNAAVNMLEISNKLENAELNMFSTKKLVSNSEKQIPKKIPLFKNEEGLKWSLVLWAHNGGGEVIKTHFPDFIQKLKTDITNPQYAECETESSIRQETCRKYLDCKKNVQCRKSIACQADEKEGKNCFVCEKCEQCRPQCMECGTHTTSLRKCEKYNGYRESLLRGRSLTISDLHKEFAQFATENKIENYKEVSTLMRKMTQRLNDLSDSGGLLTQAIDHLHPEEEGSPSSLNQEKLKFLDDVRKNCPIKHPGLIE